jgi:hypothetical protein
MGDLLLIRRWDAGILILLDDIQGTFYESDKAGNFLELLITKGRTSQAKITLSALMKLHIAPG